MVSYHEDEPVTLANLAADAIRAGTRLDHLDAAFVLGSGWAHGADKLGDTLARFDLGALPGFARPVVAGHGGEALVVRLATGKTALVLTGRTHLYEGHGVGAVTHGVRTAAALGATTMVLTNGCGGLNPDWAPGTVALISDHINLTGVSPLVGPSFVDMTDAYSPALRRLAHQVDQTLPEGVYAQFRGPNYETPAEVRMAGLLGATLVGMSTALETIAARAEGLDVLGLSLVTNPAAGASQAGQPLNHADVLAAGAAAAPHLATLLADIAVVL